MSLIGSRPFGYPRQVDNPFGSNLSGPRQVLSSARGKTDFLLPQCQTEWIDQADWGLLDGQTKLVGNSSHWTDD